MENIATLLSSTFSDSLHCLLSINYTNQLFIRLIPLTTSDHLLLYYPLVEIRCVQDDDKIRLQLVSYKLQVMDIMQSFSLADTEQICEFVRKYLLKTQFSRCQGLPSKSKSSNIVKDVESDGRTVFRSNNCKAVFIKDSDISLCNECRTLQRKPRRTKKAKAVAEEENVDDPEHVVSGEDEDRMQVKDSQKQEEFKCKICQQKYTYEKSYLKHLKVHNIYTCIKCKEEFTSEEALKSHVESSHTKVVKKKYFIDREVTCEPCDEHFENLDALSKHNIEKHNIRGDPCQICGKYLQRTSMRNHVEKIHNVETARKYTCTECGKVYKTKTDLDTHFTKHSGEKLFACQVCGKTYRFWNGLDNCLRKHEQRERYQCEWQGCGKSFNSKFRLDNHIRTHDGNKPFSCPLCSYNCSRKDNLVTHIKRTHKKTPEEIKLLGDLRVDNAEIEI